ARRPALEEAAELVRTAQPAETGEWADEGTLLLAERGRLTPDPDAPVQVTVPPHLSVSQLVTPRRAPQGLARALPRPPPRRAALRDQAGPADLIPALPEAQQT